MLHKIQFTPGVNRDVTTLSGKGGWWNTQWTRFRSTFPEKIGGWTKAFSVTTAGTIRSLFNWITLANNNLLGIGTSVKYYIEQESALYDITPVRYTVTVSGALATANGTKVITCSVPGHGGVTGDYVTLSGIAAPVSNIPANELNAEFTITVTSSDTFTFSVPTTNANATASGLGGSVTFAFQINVPDAGFSGTGWGSWVVGRGGWGSAYVTGTSRQSMLRLWSQDNYGEDLIINPRFGGLYIWDATLGVATRATNVTAAVGASDVPIYCTQVLVTDQRHVLAFGCNPLGESYLDPLLIRWSEQEDYAQWTPSATNAAGDYRLPAGSKIVRAQETRQEVLVWTDSDLYSMQYLGPPTIFSVNQVATNLSIIGPNAVATANNITYWMGVDKFYVYSGRVETLPCPVSTYVFDSFNRDEADKVICGTNERFSEIWWFYPSDGATSADRYVIFNYEDNAWYFGTRTRSAWLDSPLRALPMAAYDGQVVYQESGFDDATTIPATAISAYIESSDTDIGDGDRFAFVSRIVHDVTFRESTAANPAATVTLSVRRFPGSAFSETGSGTTTRSATSPVEQFTTQQSVRLRGRQFTFKIASTAAGVAWQLGTPRLDYRTDGRR